MGGSVWIEPPTPVVIINRLILCLKVTLQASEGLVYHGEDSGDVPVLPLKRPRRRLEPVPVGERRGYALDKSPVHPSNLLRHPSYPLPNVCLWTAAGSRSVKQRARLLVIIRQLKSRQEAAQRHAGQSLRRYMD